MPAETDLCCGPHGYSFVERGMALQNASAEEQQ